MGVNFLVRFIGYPMPDRFLLVQYFSEYLHGRHGIHDHTSKNDDILPRILRDAQCRSGYKTFAGFSLQLLDFSIDGIQSIEDGGSIPGIRRFKPGSDFRWKKPICQNIEFRLCDEFEQGSALYFKGELSGDFNAVFDQQGVPLGSHNPEGTVQDQRTGFTRSGQGFSSQIHRSRPIDIAGMIFNRIQAVWIFKIHHPAGHGHIKLLVAVDGYTVGLFDARKQMPVFLGVSPWSSWDS